MSYARFGDGSDIYLYLDVGGYFRCQVCSLKPNDARVFRFDDTICRSTDDTVAHVHAHIDAGHTILPSTIPALEADRADNDLYLGVASPATLPVSDQPSEEP